MVSCVDSLYDVDLRDCKKASGGMGIPSGAGTYSRTTHRLGLSVAFHIQ
jgi:hypothetical protein